jgi:hypothetical protein
VSKFNVSHKAKKINVGWCDVVTHCKCNNFSRGIQHQKPNFFAASEAASTLLAILCHWLRIVLNGTFSKKID